MSLADPPDHADALAGFPELLWGASQPLSRVHRQRHGTLHYATDRLGRFNPPAGDHGFGTCYLSTDPRGAFVETLGRFRVLTRRMVDERVVAPPGMIPA